MQACLGAALDVNRCDVAVARNTHKRQPDPPALGGPVVIHMHNDAAGRVAGYLQVDQPVPLKSVCGRMAPAAGTQFRKA